GAPAGVLEPALREVPHDAKVGSLRRLLPAPSQEADLREVRSRQHVASVLGEMRPELAQDAVRVLQILDDVEEEDRVERLAFEEGEALVEIGRKDAKPRGFRRGGD